MQKIVYTLLTFLISLTMVSQAIVKGTVNNQNSKAVEYIEVQLQNKDSIITKSQLTTVEGKFSIVTENGEYMLLIKQLGVVLHKQKININQNLDLGSIQITQKQEELQEVVINSKKKLIERKVDRLVFNVENSIAAVGGDALDALKVTPTIKVQNDQIAMIGKSGMRVMVDDKLILLTGDDLITFLRTIASSNIKSIEVITTPPAKYDAEGNTGLINILLKKAKKDSWYATVRSSLKQATYLSGTTGANFSYQKNKVELLLDLSAQKGKSIYTNNITYDYPTEQWKNKINNSTTFSGINPLMNASYQVSNKTKIGLQYMGGYNRPKLDENNTSNINDKQTIFLNSQLIANGNTEKNIKNHAINLNSVTAIDTLGKKMSIDMDYFSYQFEKKNNFNSEIINYLQNNTTLGYTDNSNKQKISNFSTRVDFEMPCKWANLNYGAKLSATKTNNDVKTNIYNTTGGIFEIDSNQTNVFDYEENVQALYFSSDKTINSKWEAKAGLRIEFTQTKGFSQTINETNKTSYYKFFPTAYLSYKPNEKNTYGVNFSRRIQRPSYSDLNPARWYLNSNSYEVGNPFLQPSFSTNFELFHSYRDLFTTTVYYSKNTNGFGQIVVHDIEANFQTFIRQNYFDATFFGLSESINFSAFKNCTTSISADVSYNESKTYTEYLNPNYSGWSGSFSTTNALILNKPQTLTAEINYAYNSQAKFTESRISANSNLNLAVKYAFLNKKMQVALYANDILNTQTNTLSAKTGVVNARYRQFYDTPFVRLSVSYKFGNSAKNLQKKAVSNQEEKDRVKS